MELSSKNYSQEELHVLLGYFSVKVGAVKFEPLTSGLINDTYIVYSEGNPSYILQRINERVFTDVNGLMTNCCNALKHLKAPDYAKIVLLKTKEEKNYYHGPQGFWRLVSYLPETITYNTTNSISAVYEAGRIIGRFHTLLKSEVPNDYTDTIPNFHDLNLRVDQFQKALANAPKHKIKECESSIAFVIATVALLQERITADLPVRICHNDTKLNNILFSKKTNEALCLIDLDTIMKGHLMFDFGDAVRTVVNPAKEEEQDLSLIGFRTDFFESFVKGFAFNEDIWTEQELKSLPYGAILMPFLHGLRALTDYFNGNKYYKVSYEKQNLDRALGLFQFAKKTTEHLSFMEATIIRIFRANHSK